MSNSSERWILDVKFKGRTHRLCGKIYESQKLTPRDLPRILDITMRAKLSVVPYDGSMIKFMHQSSSNARCLRNYLLARQCAICVNFSAAPYMYTFYLTCSTLANKLSHFDNSHIDRIVATPDSFVGVLSKEIDPTLVDNDDERHVDTQRQGSPTLSLGFDDPMLHLELLLDRMSGSQSAIEACSDWIMKNSNEVPAESISHTLMKFMGDQNSFRLKMNLIYLVHDLLRKVKGSKKSCEVALHMEELVASLKENIPQMVSCIRTHKDKQHKLQEVLLIWEKWNINYVITPKEELNTASSSVETDRSPSSVLSGRSSPHPIVHVEDETCMLKDSIINQYQLNSESGRIVNQLPEDRLKGLHSALKLVDQYGTRENDISSFVLRFIDHYTDGTNGRLNECLNSFAAAWGLDGNAIKLLSQVDESLVTDMWLRLRRKGGASNPSAYVVGTLIKLDLYRPSAELETFMERIEKQKAEEIVDAMRLHWELDLGAMKTIKKLEKSSLLKLAAKMRDINMERPIKNPSCTAIRCVKDLNLPLIYPRQMRSTFNDRVGHLLGQWDITDRKRKFPHDVTKEVEPSHRRRVVSDYRRVGSSSDVEDEVDLEALKRSIPSPPDLMFKKCKKREIIRQETNPGGVLAVAPSGIPGAGYGLFNLSGKVWPALTVVCLFGSRRISHDEHHDGLNKVARCGELGETFVVVNGKPRPVEEFEKRYGHRLVSYDGLVDADGSIGGYPNDRVIGYPDSMYWDASSFYNNSIIVPGCIIDTSQPSDSKIVLDQLYLITWKDVPDQEEFFLAYGTSYYPDDACNRYWQYLWIVELEGLSTDEHIEMFDNYVVTDLDILFSLQTQRLC